MCEQPAVAAAFLRASGQKPCAAIVQAMGGEITPCIFKHKDSEDKNVLILAMYPPSESVPTSEHKNRTSNEIQKIMQGFRFVWEDLFPFAPDRNADVDVTELHPIWLIIFKQE